MKNMKLGARFSILVLVAVLLSNVFSNISGLLHFKENIERQIWDKAIHTANTAAFFIDGDAFESLSHSDSTDHYYFDEGITQLNLLRDQLECKYLYAMVLNDDEASVTYILDEDPESFGTTDSMDIYAEHTLTTFKTGEVFFEKFYDAGDDGYLMTGLAPIRNLNGEIVGLIGCDIDADAVVADYQSFMVKTILSILVSSLVISSLVYFIFRRMVTKPLQATTVKAKEIANGIVVDDISEQYMNRKDEIGELVNSFSGMMSNINGCAENAQLISKGDLNVKIEPKNEDDVLAQSLQAVHTNLEMLVQELNNMATNHIMGETDVMVDTDKFTGSYKTLAESINMMVQGHMQEKQQAMDCVLAFANGDFDAKIKSFIGQKVFINEAIEALRKNLIDVNAEVSTLVQSAVQGDLSARAEINKYNGDWNGLMNQLNDLLDVVIKPVMDASAVLEKMSQGDLSARVNGEYQGDHELIKKSLNFMGESISAYVGEISDILEQMSNKNFTSSIDQYYVGDFHKIKLSINNIIGQFNEVLGEINYSSNQVEVEADQVHGLSQRISEGASEQASSVEEMSASITEVAEQTRQNAKNAEEANTTSIKAKENAIKGNEDMKQMLEAMGAIKSASNNIANIIRVIDDIAFQTNILALNAAVEAARAGEHGKGFAVVAEEVRNLAERSANAAKETTELIDHSIKQVEQGYDIAHKTAEGLEDIVTGVTEAVEIVNTIALASSEQASAVGQISVGIEQINQVTQSSTNLSSESATASEKMMQQSHELKALINEFELKE